MCRLHCHLIVKLSGALQILLPDRREIVCNVHGTSGSVAHHTFQRTVSSAGVRETFLRIGDVYGDGAGLTRGAYFVGKLAWPKGLAELLQLMHFAQSQQ